MRHTRLFVGLAAVAVVLPAAPASAASGHSGALTLDELSGAIVAINCRKEGVRGGYLGTGTLVHPDGYVLTSTTVVPPEAVDIRCHFVDALNRPGRLVHADQTLELAVIRVDPNDLPDRVRTVTFRRSRSVRVGETAFSFGDVLAAFVRSGRFTVSLGLVSGLYETTRNVTPQPVYVGGVIETTATMAAGMDGGPLFDASGRMVGLLSLNVSDIRWLGTAVPADAFIDRLAEIIAEDRTATAPGGGGEEEAPAVLSVAEGKGPSMFPRRDRVNALFAAAAEKLACSMVAVSVDRKKDRPTTRRRPRGRPRGGYRAILKRPKAPVTGWLVSEAGHVLTTWFNVWGRLRKIEVTLDDGRTVRARLLGRDEQKDLALLKFDPGELKAGPELRPLRLSPGELEIGTPIAVVALGPGGSPPTLARGIVSATGRLDGAGVQIDAPVNYGSAGGAVLDLNGRCVAVVSHVRTDSLWSQNSGVGLAMDARAIREVLPRLKAGRTIAKPKRGYLGIRMSAGSLKTAGVVVEQVQDDSPAAEAGLKAQDVIAAVDGRKIADPADLARAIGGAKPGAQVKLTVLRDGKRLTVRATLDEHPYR
jgi:S1-C subfamily serine protease